MLAFTNMSGDPAQAYFAEGLADDIITELSRSRSLFVIARNSSFPYKGRSDDIKQVARELSVRYIVAGSLRRGGGRIRISAQLIDAEAGHHLWAERYDPDEADLWAAQDQITIAIATAIHPAIAAAEWRRLPRKPQDSPSRWELYQRGLWHMAKYTAADNERAIEYFRHAIELDETFMAAYCRLAFAYRESGQAYGIRSLDEGCRVGWNLGTQSRGN